MTRLCVAIFVKDVPSAQRDIALAAEAGADIVELRIDSFADPIGVEAIIKSAAIPTIVTLRSSAEGGLSDLSDRTRLQFLDEHAHGSSFIDVELESLENTSYHFSQPNRPQIIVSSHDFHGRPERLYNLIAELNASAGDVNKIVWMARTVRDNLEAFELLQTRQKPTIALCMGEEGLLSRLLAKKFGAFLTFASLSAASGTAPGQVSAADMKRLYRWDAIRPDTCVYGVIGSPVAHSMSPAVHNAAFAETGFDGVYVPLLVNEGYESFKAFMESFVPFEGLDLSGLSVTIPHKENALRYLKEKGAEIEQLAADIGAVNTIVIDRPEGHRTARLRGFSSDYAAILDSLTDRLGVERKDLSQYRVAVLGAGGTGRTAVAALAACGATVVVYNRTFDRACALAQEFNGRTGKVVAAPLEKLCDSCCQIYLNTTSVGMQPKIDLCPFGDAPPRLDADSVVFDAVYNPMHTRLIEQAEAAGAKTIGGVEMFVRQAAAQFTAWTGLPAPMTTMRKVIESRLSR